MANSLSNSSESWPFSVGEPLRVAQELTGEFTYRIDPGIFRENSLRIFVTLMFASVYSLFCDVTAQLMNMPHGKSEFALSSDSQYRDRCTVDMAPEVRPVRKRVEISRGAPPEDIAVGGSYLIRGADVRDDQHPPFAWRARSEE